MGERFSSREIRLSCLRVFQTNFCVNVEWRECELVVFKEGKESAWLKVPMPEFDDESHGFSGITDPMVRVDSTNWDGRAQITWTIEGVEWTEVHEAPVECFD